MAGKKQFCVRPVHKDVEFAVEVEGSGDEEVFNTFAEASTKALELAISKGSTVHLDVLVSSEAGAAAWAGDDGVEQYNEDPDASVFERFEVSVNAAGRVS